jgi:hypothetical protein
MAPANGAAASPPSLASTVDHGIDAAVGAVVVANQAAVIHKITAPANGAAVSTAKLSL